MAKNKTAKLSMVEDDKKWEAEDDCRTLKRVAEINKDPERLKRAQKKMQEEMDDIKTTIEFYKGKSVGK